MSLLKKVIEWYSHLSPKTLCKLFLGIYFILGIHYSVEGMTGWGLYLPTNVIGWMFVITFTGLGLWQIILTGNIQWSKTLTLLWLGFFCFILPLLYPINEISYNTTARVLFLFGGLAFYTALVQFRYREQERIQLLYIILAAIILQSIFGMIQYFGVWSESFWFILKKSSPYGSFTQRNVMATFMATGIVVSLFLIGKDDNLIKSKIKTYMILFIPFSASIIIMVHNSKVGFLGLIVLALQLPNVSLGKKIYQFWFFMLFTGLIIGWFSPDIYRSVQSKKDDFNIRDSVEQVSSIQSRITVYKRTLKMWIDNPVSGIGYGRWPRVFREYSVSQRNENSQKDYVGDSPYRHPHNETLLWISEGGILPFLGLIIFAGAYLIMVFQFHWKDALPFLSLIMPIFLHTQVEYPFDISLAHWIVFIIIIYLPDNYNNIYYQIRIRKVIIVPAILTQLLLYYYMVATFFNANILIHFENTEMKDNKLLLDIKDSGALYLKHENYLLKMLLESGLKSQNEETLELFLIKGEKFVNSFPKLHIYHGMKVALLTLGRKKEAMTIDQKERYLFPYTYSKFHNKLSSLDKIQ